MVKPAARELAIDPGARPPVDDDQAVDEPLDDGYVAPPLEPAGELPEWEVRTVGFLLGLVFLGLHLTLGRGGPDDAFLPSPAARREMATPGAAALNRSQRLRRLAPAGDGIAFVGLVGEFLLSEQARVARYQHGGASTAPAADLGLGGFVTTVADDASPSAGAPAPPTVRPWRPPTLPEEDV